MSETLLELVSAPDGPMKHIASLGQSVGVFLTEPGGKTPALNYHVPLECRGPFKPKELATYDPRKQYRTDEYGYVLCYSKTVRDSKCARRAVNRTPKCEKHGGRLHPLDKVKKKEEYEDGAIETLDRYQQYLAGQISVEDLDDEELATGSFRAPNGKLYRPKNLPREIVKEFHKAIYSRAEDGLRSGVVIGANTIVEIASNRAVEPADRIKAAQILLDRGLGKAPDRVQVGIESKGFEELFDKIANVTRDQSRQMRGISEGYIEGEVVESNDILPEVPAEQEKVPGDTGDELQDILSGVSERAYSRHPAVMAQSIEVKQFQYDLSDPSAAINKERSKRYAANKLKMTIEDLESGRLGIELLPVGDGTARVKFTYPDRIKVPSHVVAKEKKKRKFDNNPFPER